MVKKIKKYLKNIVLINTIKLKHNSQKYCVHKENKYPRVTPKFITDS